MGRKRKENKHLPEGVYFKHGAYYIILKHPIRKWVQLGKSIAEMYANLAKYKSPEYSKNTMNSLFDRYINEVACKHAPDTYKQNLYNMKELRDLFGEWSPTDIRPVHIYRYRDNRSKISICQANKEKSLLSSVFNAAISWGLVETNPCKEIPNLPEPKRNRYIEDKEFRQVYKYASPMIRVAMRLALATGLRQADILKMKLNDIKEEGIEVHIQKTGEKILIEWTEGLRRAVAKAKRLPRSIRGFNLLCTHKGQKYSRHGFSAIWRRTVQKCVEMGKIESSFTFHDIRHKAATDAEKMHGREFARQLLDHQTQKTTARYIAGVRRVKALY